MITYSTNPELQKAFLLGYAWQMGRFYSHLAKDDAAFEAKHNRDDDGQFATQEGSGAAEQPDFAKLPDGYIEGKDALSHVSVVDDDAVVESFKLYSNDTSPDAPYAQINGALWSGNPVPAEFAHHVDKIQSHIEAHPIDAGVRVSRGVDPRFFEQFLAPDYQFGEDEIEMPAFTSTSVTSSVAKDFADKKVFEGMRLIQVLDVPEGHPAVNMSQSSAYEDEDEILLPIGTKVTPSGRMESEGYTYLYFKVTPWKQKEM